MKLERFTRGFVAIVGAGVLMVGFQNCAKVGLSSGVDFSNASLQAAAPSATDLPSTSDSASDSPSCDSKSHAEESGSGFVECELISPNTKVILADQMSGSPSNSSSTRICMSEYACLNLVNDYAVTHDCSLAAGAATSPSSNGVQCTKIFPGSKGTCKNAKALSDSDVSALLAKLGK